MDSSALHIKGLFNGDRLERIPSGEGLEAEGWIIFVANKETVSTNKALRNFSISVAPCRSG